MDSQAFFGMLLSVLIIVFIFLFIDACVNADCKPKLPVKPEKESRMKIGETVYFFTAERVGYFSQRTVIQTGKQGTVLGFDDESVVVRETRKGWLWNYDVVHTISRNFVVNCSFSHENVLNRLVGLASPFKSK